MRDFRGLLKIAGLEGKSAPPNTGLNEPNPLKREVYREVGYIPDHRNIDNFTEADFEAMGKIGKILDKYSNIIRFRRMSTIYPYLGRMLGSYGVSDYTGPKLLPAQLFDLYNSIGAKKSSFNFNFQKDNSKLGYRIDPYKPFITLGNVTQPTEEILRHELGHFDDYRYKYKLDPYLMQSDRKNPKTQLDTEIRAWNYAGIPEGHPIRESALDSYRAIAGVPLKYFSNSYDTDKLQDTRSKYYKPPETYINKYKDSGIPIIWDYHSATNAAHNGIDLSNHAHPDIF